MLRLRNLQICNFYNSNIIFSFNSDKFSTIYSTCDYLSKKFSRIFFRFITCIIQNESSLIFSLLDLVQFSFFPHFFNFAKRSFLIKWKLMLLLLEISSKLSFKSYNRIGIRSVTQSRSNFQSDVTLLQDKLYEFQHFSIYFMIFLINITNSIQFYLI